MRLFEIFTPSLLFGLAIAVQLPNLQPYLSAIIFPISIADYIPPPPPAEAPSAEQRQHELLKRQFRNTCPEDFNPCDNVGAPGLCCAEGAACAADDAGNVACCPAGAFCTGVINGVITAGTVDSNGHLVSASAGESGVAVAGAGGGQVVTSVGSSYVLTASGSDVGGLVGASSLSTAGPVVAASSGGGGFIVDGSSVVATPGAAVRGAAVPIIAKVIVRVLEMVPL